MYTNTIVVSHYRLKTNIQKIPSEGLAFRKLEKTAMWHKYSFMDDFP